MNKEEIKSEIIKSLDGISENLLLEILKTLKSAGDSDKNDMEIIIDLNRVLIEDKELYIKLAS
jgi:hypothetical protein